MVARPPILVTRRVPGDVYASLASDFDVRYHDSEAPPSRSELLERAAGVAGLVTTLSDTVDGELLDAAGEGLRVVANYAVGYDNVDVEAASERGVMVTNTPDVLTEATAEFAIALALALVRRVAEGDRFLRRRPAWIWAPTFMVGPTLRGATFGVVGFGRIGREVARIADALGANVVIASTKPESSVFAQLPLPTLLEIADVVSLHCPLTPETFHLIGADELDRMREGAVLVNTARGPVVDEQALIRALEAGKLGGAALDVYEREPAVPDALLALDNVVLAPHLGSATIDARTAMGMLCVDALRAVLLDDRVPENALNAADARRLHTPPTGGS